MSLDKHPKGNPQWQKGKSGNPNGRPVGAKSLKTILKVAATLGGLKRHPVEELVRIADEAEKNVMGGKDLAAKIWADLLKYCEPQKKAVETAPEKALTPEESLENADRLLKEMENIGNGNSGTDTSPISSDSSSLDNGTAPVSIEANPESNLPEDKAV